MLEIVLKKCMTFKFLQRKKNVSFTHQNYLKIYRITTLCEARKVSLLSQTKKPLLILDIFSEDFYFNLYIECLKVIHFRSNNLEIFTYKNHLI